MQQVEGTVRIVQEGRFMLTEDDGRTHLFILAHDAAAEADQLEPLQGRQARVRVTFREDDNLIARVAKSVRVVEG
jgi:hypothetical protein